MGRFFANEQEFLTALASSRSGKKVVFTNGCFDILHIGHVRYLQEARSLGDLLVVGLNSDKSVKSIKGPDRPVQCEEDRGGILAALACVDFVIPFSEDTPQRLIEAVRPDVLVKGGDWPVEKIVGAEFVLKNGGEVKTLQFVEGRSTTSIIEKMK
ncbi:MAG: D-glycero-beta-D-manno-heptose 1-phosphate adenylyltransferase [Bdellovibrionaceae bacterium]|nr:D-glycero-beta-D-manno-heptose 1-phosphate adenylyltransferase [Bdellovibrionales bacterium]MCB9084867.1 D-glycero-beta-D-manno-heptose 1-phosphate adenylyltransferase [Pseudobdellovibrionaceae bacterium]